MMISKFKDISVALRWAYLCYLRLKHSNGIDFCRFNDDPGAEKKMLPQYDEPDTDEVS